MPMSAKVWPMADKKRTVQFRQNYSSHKWKCIKNKHSHIKYSSAFSFRDAYVGERNALAIHRIIYRRFRRALSMQ